MLFLISPAKTLDYDTPLPTTQHSLPQMLPQAQELITHLRTFTAEEVGALMKISDKLSALNVDRYQTWTADHALGGQCRQAMLAFKGDVYHGLDAYSWTGAMSERAQAQLRILSGLYGVLRPLDLLRPYRLEMGTRLAYKEHTNLYGYWGTQVTEVLNADLAQMETPCVINLASNEYYSVVKPKLIQAPIITPEFKDWKNGKYKIISFYAKKARGLMVKWALENEVNAAEGLKEFNVDGYAYNPDMSSDTNWVFTRNQVS